MEATATVDLDKPDPKKNSVRFNGGDRDTDVVSSVYVNRSHPDIANARAIRVTVAVIK